MSLAFRIWRSRADPEAEASEAAKLAFWINAYNAVTIEGILRKYPTTSIRNHTSPALGYNIWKHLKLQVAGEKYSLNSIEHDILRTMHEPRIHFAIVCASIGCPRLLNEAYTETELVTQLTHNARDFFSRDRNLQVDSARSALKLSSIIKWFGSDFGNDKSSQIEYLKAYFPQDAQAFVQSTAGRGDTIKLKFLDYDWELNEQKNNSSQFWSPLYSRRCFECGNVLCEITDSIDWFLIAGSVAIFRNPCRVMRFKHGYLSQG